MPNNRLPYVFENFENFVYESSSDNETSVTTSHIERETNQIIRLIDRELLTIPTKKQARFYIRKIDLAISVFQNSINKSLNENPPTSRELSLKACLENLDSIRFHLETEYRIYWNQQLPLSKKSLRNYKDSLEPDILRVKESFAKDKIPSDLSRIIIQSIERKLDDASIQVTHQRMDYLTNFISELLLFIESRENLSEQQLIKFLCIINFNSVAMLTYISEKYERCISEIEDTTLLLEYLNETRNEINHLAVNYKEPYNTNLPDLRSLVQNWLKEEINKTKKKLRRNLSSEKDTKQGKLKFRHSVDVITAFFRLLHDTGITHSGANQTVRWLSKNISSKNQSNISQQSIQRKFFEKHADKQPLKDLVLNLLNYLNRKQEIH